MSAQSTETSSEEPEISPPRAAPLPQRFLVFRGNGYSFFFSSFAANAGSGALVDITGRRVLLQAISLVIGGGALFIMGLISDAAFFSLFVAS